jgi:hypothetical protein
MTKSRNLNNSLAAKVMRAVISDNESTDSSVEDSEVEDVKSIVNNIKPVVTGDESNNDDSSDSESSDSESSGSESSGSESSGSESSGSESSGSESSGRDSNNDEPTGPVAANADVTATVTEAANTSTTADTTADAAGLKFRTEAALMNEALEDPLSNINKVLSRATNTVNASKRDDKFMIQVTGAILMSVLFFAVTVIPGPALPKPVASNGFTYPPFGTNINDANRFISVTTPIRKCPILKLDAIVQDRTSAVAKIDMEWLIDYELVKSGNSIVHSRILHVNGQKRYMAKIILKNGNKKMLNIPLVNSMMYMHTLRVNACL